jgi:hypothetical protein
VSTPDSFGRHEARTSDPSLRPSYQSADDPDHLYYSDSRDDRGSPYYRDLRDLRDDDDSAYYRALREDHDAFYDEDAPYDSDTLHEEPSSSGTLRHVLSAFFCLALTPIGIVAMTYGADRYWHLTLQQVSAERDLRGLLALGVGAGLLLIVACLGAVSPIGPVLSGVIWGLAPAGCYLIYPRQTARRVSDLPFLPDLAASGAMTWLEHAAFLMVGAMLVGAGLGAAMRRPTRT